jgi:hypothetical protein
MMEGVYVPGIGEVGLGLSEGEDPQFVPTTLEQQISPHTDSGTFTPGVTLATLVASR